MNPYCFASISTNICVIIGSSTCLPLSMQTTFSNISDNESDWALIQVMACRLFGDKPLPEPMPSLRQLHDTHSQEIQLRFQNRNKKRKTSFHKQKQEKCRLQNAGHLLRPQRVKILIIQVCTSSKSSIFHMAYIIPFSTPALYIIILHI